MATTTATGAMLHGYNNKSSSKGKLITIVLIVVGIATRHAIASNAQQQHFELPQQQQPQQQQQLELLQEWQSALAATQNASVVAVNAPNNNNSDRDNMQPAVATNEQAGSATQESKAGSGFTASGEKLLSRKRRYLLFPEGSSFQLVYDGIYGVVDYGNYLILGITVALAWELPTKAPSEMLEDIRGRLANGTILSVGRRNDTAGKITYTDHKPHYIDRSTFVNNNNNYKQYYTNGKWRPATGFQLPMHKQYYSDYYSPRQPLTATRPKDYYYRNKYSNNNSKYSYRYNPYTAALKQTPADAAKFPWWRLTQGLSNAPRWQAAGQQGQRRFDQPQPGGGAQQQPTGNGYYQHNASAATPKTTPRQQATNSRRRTLGGNAKRKHRIFPIFGKRRRRRSSRSTEPATRHGLAGGRRGADEALSKVDRIHIRLQRRSRRSLYDKIEKYLDKRGSNGHHCVLRALCETAQKSASATEPGTFVAEIMRALFTLPEAIEGAAGEAEEYVDHLQQRYDAAHAYAGDCAARYQHCQDSLWASHFVH